MKNSTVSQSLKTKSSNSEFRKTNSVTLFCIAGAILLIALAVADLFVGKYRLSFHALLSGDAFQWRVFLSLRVARMLVGLIGGITLGVTGYVYQTVFHNSLASPDIVGISSGASAGAAAGILVSSRTAAGTFLAGILGVGASVGTSASATAGIFSGLFRGSAASAQVTAFAFAGAFAALFLALLFSSIDRSGHKGTIVLSGIAVHALAQTALMGLKLTADPERELASIEYWIMGSLNGISSYGIGPNLILAVLCIIVLFVLFRQIMLLSAEEGEARMLGVSVGRLRAVVLIIATLGVSAVISLTGLISFIGLLAPHGARLLLGKDRKETMFLSGILGGILLCGADMLARSVAATELPVSIFTSLLGAPFLIWLVVRRARKW